MAISFPKIPSSKTIDGIMTHPEQRVILKLIHKQEINREEEEVLEESIEYYKILYPFLKSINLSLINDEEANEILTYTHNALSMIINSKNIIQFQYVYRVSIVKDTFLQNDKVKDLGFITYPPLDLIKKLNVFGRANTPKSTVFYCSFQPGVAIFETKPKVNERIIIAQWHNYNKHTFMSCPISNNKTVINNNVKAATKSFEELKKRNHPLFAEIMDMYLDFFSSEIVKNVKIKSPKKYEYLFSSLFADLALSISYYEGQNVNDAKNNVECLIYPSVAYNHKQENLAIVPEAMKKLIPVKLWDGIVISTNYDNTEISGMSLPIELKLLRESTQFDGSRIIWNDES